MTTIAFIGLGHMGGGMAANLAKAGHDVRAFDLSAAALETAKANGCCPSRVPPRLSLRHKSSLRCSRRTTFGSPAGAIQPMPVPRFSATPVSPRAATPSEADVVLERWRLQSEP